MSYMKRQNLQQRQMMQVGTHLSSRRTELALTVAQRAVQKGKMLLCIMHVYLCMHIVLVSQYAWCHHQAVPASILRLLVACTFVCICMSSGYCKLLDRGTPPQHNNCSSL